MRDSEATHAEDPIMERAQDFPVAQLVELVRQCLLIEDSIGDLQALSAPAVYGRVEPDECDKQREGHAANNNDHEPQLQGRSVITRGRRIAGARYGGLNPSADYKGERNN